MRRRLGLTLALVGLLLVLARPVSAALPIDRPTDAQWAQTLAAAGQWVDLQVALQVMFAESGGNPIARNPSGARGAWQFMPNTLADDDCAYDPVCSTAAAFRTSAGGTDWHRWVAYTSGAYTSTATRAAAALQAAGLNPQPQPGPPIPSLPPPPTERPASSAGMGVDGLIPPPPIRNGNAPMLFERYPPGSYGAMHLNLVRLAQSAIGAVLGLTDPGQVTMNVSLNTAASLATDVLVLIGIVTTRLLAWSLRVDLLASADGPLNAFVGGLAQGLYQPLIPLLLTVFVGWLIWTWLLRRRTTRGLVGIGWMFLALTLGSIYFAAPAAVLDQASAFTSSISRSVLGAVGGADAQVGHRGDPTVAQGPTDDAELRLFSDRYWSTYVLTPWQIAQFGRSDLKGEGGQSLGVELLDKRAGKASNFDADMAQQSQEVRDWYDGANGVQRLVIIGVALLVALIACVIFLAAAVVRLASAVVFLALLMALPIFLLMALHPSIGRKLLLRWVELAVGALWRQVVYTLFLAVMVVLVGVVSAAAAVGGWGLVALCQLAAAAGILIFRKPLLAIFGQLGAHRLKIEHVGQTSRLSQAAHAGMGEARRRAPIPAFAQRATKAKALNAAGGGTAAGGSKAATAATSAATKQAASGAATAGAGVATGGWALAAAVALKAGQVAVRRGEVARRQLQDAAASPFLLNGKAGKPPPRRMAERPLGVDRRALTSHVWTQVRHRPRFAEEQASTAVVDATPEPEALPPAKEPKTPKAPRTSSWTREPGGGHVFTPRKGK